MSVDGIILTFPAGLVGFPELKVFRLFEPAEGYPLKFLQSTEHPEVSFVCMDAIGVELAYEVPLGEEDARFLDLERQEDAMVLLLLSIPEDPREMTANLAGPLVVNGKTLQGRQIILDTQKYSLKHKVIAPKEDLIISFPQGLVGYPELRTFRLFEPPDGYPLKFLQSVEKAEVSFTAIDAAAVKLDYAFDLSDEDAAALAIETLSDTLVLALVVIPADPRQMTANLAGPVVINAQNRQGRQIVLNTEKYPLKYPVIQDRSVQKA